MKLRDKVEEARAKPTWRQDTEELETFLRRELGLVQAKYVPDPAKPRIMTDELLGEIRDDIHDVFIRAGIDPATIDLNIGFEEGLMNISFQPADFKQQREASEKRAESGNIVEAFGTYMDACKAVQRAANIIKPLVESLEDSGRRLRVLQLLETQISINDRAAVAMGELLLGEVERAEIGGSHEDSSGNA